jgi:SET domain-containing protein
MGNKTRFINHGNESEGKTNVVSLNMFSCGQEYIGLYALKDIEIGEELLFDYDGDGEVAKTYSGLYSFLQKNKRI